MMSFFALSFLFFNQAQAFEVKQTFLERLIPRTNTEGSIVGYEKNTVDFASCEQGQILLTYRFSYFLNPTHPFVEIRVIDTSKEKVLFVNDVSAKQKVNDVTWSVASYPGGVTTGLQGTKLVRTIYSGQLNPANITETKVLAKNCQLLF